jgi:hypothetical protein
VDDSIPQPAEQVDPLLAIRQAGVLLRNDRMVEHRLTSLEIQPVAAEVGLSFLLIPGDHSLSVATKKSGVKFL